jgi:hypothetical protein
MMSYRDMMCLHVSERVENEVDYEARTLFKLSRFLVGDLVGVRKYSSEWTMPPDHGCDVPGEETKRKQDYRFLKARRAESWY